MKSGCFVLNTVKGIDKGVCDVVSLQTKFDNNKKNNSNNNKKLINKQ